MSNDLKVDNVKELEEKKNVVKVPKGQPKSGRNWKSEAKPAYLRVIENIPKSKRTLEYKMKLKEERSRAKELERELIEKRKEKKALLRKRQEENKKRRAENELKSSTYQVIKDVNKIKKMSKKQLKMIKKSRVNAQGVVEYVPLYS